MIVQRNLEFPNLAESLSAVYSVKEYTAEDSEIRIYNKYKISILLSDGLAAVTKNAVIDAGKNNILFFRPDEIHFGRFLRAGVHSFIDFYIPLDFFKKVFGDLELMSFFEDRAEDRINYIVFDADTQKTVIDIAKKTVNILCAEHRADNIKLFSLILQIIILCSENYEKQKKNPQIINMPEYVAKTLLFISENYREKLSLSSLAKNAGCSVTYLARIFKQYTGKTIYNHIIDVRIGNAETLLNQGFGVTDACFSSGFDDCSNFIRTFKSITGKTPLQFKHDNVRCAEKQN